MSQEILIFFLTKKKQVENFLLKQGLWGVQKETAEPI